MGGTGVGGWWGNPYYAPIGGKAQIQVEKGLFVRCSRDSVLAWPLGPDGLSPTPKRFYASELRHGARIKMMSGRIKMKCQVNMNLMLTKENAIFSF